jgi:hypothetical protein
VQCIGAMGDQLEVEKRGQGYESQPKGFNSWGGFPSYGSDWNSGHQGYQSSTECEESTFSVRNSKRVGRAVGTH